MKIIFPSLGSFEMQEIAQMRYFNNDYTGQTLKFCSEWLSGQSSFTVPTSGSTGAPKPTALMRSQMQASAQMTAKALGLISGDHALVCLNTAYIAGKMMLVRGMETGMDLTVIPPASHPLRQFAGATFDFTAMVPLQLQQTLTDQPGCIPVLESMKAIIVGGAAVSYQLQTLTGKLSVPVFNTYGMTETVSHIALKRLNPPAETYETLPGVEIAQDARGCLMIKAPMSNHRWLTTNDLVKIIDTQHFEWLGRADNVINSGGVKVQAEKVEQAVERLLTQLGIQSRFIVTGIQHALFGEEVSLIIESPPLLKAQEQHLLNGLAQVLGRYEVPRAVHYLKKFRETETGKIDRRNTVKDLGI